MRRYFDEAQREVEDRHRRRDPDARWFRIGRRAWVFIAALVAATTVVQLVFGQAAVLVFLTIVMAVQVAFVQLRRR